MPVATLWLTVPACGVPASTVREECGVLERVPYGVSERLSEKCIVKLASDIGLDWHSFGASPADIPHDGASPAAVVLSGLYTLAMSDTGLGWNLSRAPNPPHLQTEFLTHPKANASDFWYDMVARRVNRTVFRPDIQTDDHIMSYAADASQVTVADLSKLPDRGPGAPPRLLPITSAATLVHEAAHAFAGRHLVTSNTDVDSNSAYGIEATWLSDWIASNANAVSSDDYNSACWTLSGVCRNIRVDAYPCNRLSALCANTGLPLSAARE